MRIGLDIRLLGEIRTGKGNYIYHLVKNLFQLDKKNHYLLFASIFKNAQSVLENGRLLAAEHDNAKVTVLKMPGKIGSLLWKYTPFLPPQLYFEKLDISHFLYYPILTPSGGKLIATVHDLTPLRFPEFHIFREVVKPWSDKAKSYLNKMNSIIVFSDNTKNDIIEILKIPEYKIKVIYLGVGERYKKIHDINSIKEILGKYAIDFPYILSVGTLEPRKNFVRLIKAFHRLMKDYALKGLYKLVIVGVKGWSCEDIFKKVEELELKNDVIFTGFVPDEDLPFLMNGACLFVYPSLYEGFGLPPLEALACGVPVITSNNSSLPEVVGEAAIMIDPYDVDEIAHAMHNVLTKETQNKILVRKGLERAKKFSWSETARKTLEVYEEVARN
jgi:glycosyltransferase involved in cell wall biosynthesis